MDRGKTGVPDQKQEAQPAGLLGIAGRLIDLVADIGAGISATIIIAMAAVVFYEIVMRGLFNMPTTWVLEYTTYSLVAAGFFGAGYVTKLDGHVKVDVITGRLSPRTGTIMEFVNLLWSIGVVLVLIGSSIFMVRESYTQNRVATSILETPMWITEVPMVIGSIILLLMLVKKMLQNAAAIGKTAGTAPARRTWVSPVDKPAILIPLVFVLLAIGAVLFNMGGSTQILGFILVMLTLFATGTPIFIVLAILGSFGLFCLLGADFNSQIQVALQGYKALDSFTLVAIPLFVMGASIFASTRLTDGLFDVVKAWLSFLPANLLMSTIVCCAIFAAITGSSVACAATIALVAVPPMMKANYERKWAYGSLAAGGTLGILIPPSLSFIMIGEITQMSVGQLFMAGVVPGIMLTVLFMLFIWFGTRGNPVYRTSIETYTWSQRIRLIKSGGPVLMAPVIVLGGIYTGLFTPTEAAAVAVIYGIVLAIARGRLRLDNFVTCLIESTRTSVMLMMIIVGAVILGSVVTILRIPQNASEMVIAAGIPGWIVVVLMCGLLFILGMFLECASITLICTPIFFPVIEKLGYDPIWFAVLFTVNMELALITPPVGMNLYVLQATTGDKLELIMKSAIPWVFIMIAGIIIIGLFPPLSTWLPSMMFGK
ncbi:MAG TPA: TRAP transporter large permease subunit [Syntrophorhabdaceae bacterium]|nr:TRAP transporter large permease subunit [Syntrophorhabdaceae bacterium]HQM81942.1 TRAP transporter large permease subunit [Syntrophorhabdaceae bacterium]